MVRLHAFLLFVMFAGRSFGAPTESLVVSTTQSSSADKSGKEGGDVTLTEPEIYQMHVVANVSNRFAHTTITSKVKNVADKSQEATFSVVLPESAFISGFIMEVDGKNYTAYVQEKEEAAKTYDRAVAQGLGAAHVAVSARDSNRFTVSVNIEPETKSAFYLTYEELLKRDNGHYDVVINLHPGQPVKDLSVEVLITESRKITELKAPPLRSGNEIGAEKDELDPRAELEVVNDTSAIVRFVPNVETQKQFAQLLKTDETKGLAGQFVVQYDVERDPSGGEVLIQDGYFVHFFAPSELTPIPKHVVFVLDTSGSMYGKRIKQLTEAMFKILEQLHENDLFSLIEFNSNVKVWDLNNAESSVWYPTDAFVWSASEDDLLPYSNYSFPRAYHANGDNIKKAKATVNTFNAHGGTDIYTALKTGLYLVELEKTQKIDKVDRQPMILFLTDGEPSARVTSTTAILNKIFEYNRDERKSTIYALSFGDEADRDFLQKLALRNQGFSKYIYESADASLQLQDFYRQISSPLLSNVTFNYKASSADSLTKTEYPLLFGGGEIAICGWYPEFHQDIIDPEFAGLPYPDITAWNGWEHVQFQPVFQHAVTNIERVWAYLTIKQLLEKKEISEDNQEELKKKVLELSLKYSFVTPVSSMVVVKPNATNAVNTEAADPEGDAYLYGEQKLLAAKSIGSPRRFYKAPQYDSYDFDNDDVSSETSYNIISSPTVNQTDTASRIPLPADPSSVLSWLNDILNDENETLALDSGNYKMGWNETFSSDVACPKTPISADGHCKLLHQCPQIYSLLTTRDIFLEYFCEPEQGFAGVCCPVQP